MAKESMAAKFIKIARENNTLKGRDQRRMVMRNIVYLALRMGLKFNPKDYHYFVYPLIGNEEYFYAEAIRHKNTSAVLAYEAYTKRKPFRYNDVNTGLSHRIRGESSRKRERLAVGFEFTWKDEKVRVTKIVDISKPDESYLIACSYKPKKYDKNGYAGPDKILHRHRIKHADLEAANVCKKKEG